MKTEKHKKRRLKLIPRVLSEVQCLLYRVRALGSQHKTVKLSHLDFVERDEMNPFVISRFEDKFSVVFESSRQGWIQNFLGCQPQNWECKPNYFGHFPQKLHEVEKQLDREGASLAPP